MNRLVLIAASLLAFSAMAQESASFKLNEHSLNNGGRPEQGTVATSASFRISIDALGDLGQQSLSSASFGMDGGFVAPYPPPGEVTGLVMLADDQTIQWDPEKSVGTYNLYRDLISGLAGLGYGACEQHALPGEAATDLDTPPSADGYFFLVTAENLLTEEGTKGFDSATAERPNPAPCP